MLARRRSALLAALTMMAACGDAASTTSTNATAPVDAGVDAGATVPSPCRGGGRRGAPLGEPIDSGSRLVGVAGGRIYWANESSKTLWSMSEDGGDRRALSQSQLPPNAIFTMDADAIYAGAWAGTWSYIRVPLTGGPATAVAIDDRLVLIATDADHLYATGPLPDDSSGGILRIPKGGGPAVLLGSDDGDAVLGGSTMWLSRADGLGWVDALGGPLQAVNRATGRCTYLRADATHVACDLGGGLVLASRDTPLQVLIAPPLGTISDKARFMPRLFIRRGGVDGVLFESPREPRQPASFGWVDLKGGRPSEVACSDYGLDMATNGDSLFILDANDYGDQVSPTFISRVDLR